MTTMKRFLPMLFGLVLLPACNRFSPAILEENVTGNVEEAVLISDALSGESVYLLDAPWTDQAGVPASLQAFLGRPVVLTFVYTRCGATCPMLVHNMKQIAKGLDPEARAQTAFVLVSLDPERDTPEQLQKFAKAHGLSQPEWTFLRGSREDIRALVASVSVGYRNQSDGQIAHANLLTILNQKGEVAGQVPGSGATQVAVRMLDSLVAAPVTP